MEAIPEEGQRLELDGLSILVTRVDGARIVLIEVLRKEPEEG
jgi:CBS domain containing-hemolysin-like protein